MNKQPDFEEWANREVNQFYNDKSIINIPKHVARILEQAFKLGIAHEKLRNIIRNEKNKDAECGDND